MIGASVSERTNNPSIDDLAAQLDKAERQLKEAAQSADAATERATAEIRALESDLEKERGRTEQALRDLKARHEEELKRERDAKEHSIAAAESRLAEIETHADAAEKRVEDAERRAAAVEAEVSDSEARAREAAAAWLRGQIDAIRREAESR
jgi:chromosome segregation ATPase